MVQENLKMKNKAKIKEVSALLSASRTKCRDLERAVAACEQKPTEKLLITENTIMEERINTLEKEKDVSYLCIISY